MDAGSLAFHCNDRSDSRRHAACKVGHLVFCFASAGLHLNDVYSIRVSGCVFLEYTFRLVCSRVGY